MRQDATCAELSFVDYLVNWPFWNLSSVKFVPARSRCCDERTDRRSTALDARYLSERACASSGQTAGNGL